MAGPKAGKLDYESGDPTIEEVDAFIALKGRRLRFPQSIERLFDVKRRSYRAKAMIISIAPSVACYNVFLPADWFLTPKTAWTAAVLHAAITGWFLIARILFRLRLALTLRELISVSMPVLMALQVLWIYALNDGEPGAADYQYLAVVIVVFMNVNLRPDFRFAFAASVGLFIVYVLVLERSQAAFPTKLIGSAIMAAAVQLTLAANLRMELDARYTFLRRLRDRLRRESAEVEAGCDPLTGLHNRRRLDQRATALWAAIDRSTPMAVIMIDVDHFKIYNDRHGHLAGDLCLTSVAGCVTGAVRSAEDTCARFGGEEIVVLMPDCDLATAVQRAERIRVAVEALADGHDAPIHVTVSAGVSSASAGEGALLELIAKADAALYAAKRSGRNRVWPPCVEASARTDGFVVPGRAA